MKKIFVTLLAIAGISMCASAQYTYYIGSHHFSGGGINTTDAYSGKNRNSDGYNYQNRVSTTELKDAGAIPTGMYYIVGVNNSKGTNTIVLSHDTHNDMYGRDGFRIHGDNAAGNASQGCIILNANERAKIATEFSKRSRNDAILTLQVYE